MNTQSYYKEILNKFDKLTKREYANLSLSGIQLALISIAAAFLFFCFIEMAGHFSAAIRTIIFIVFIIFASGSLIYLFGLPFSRYLNLLKREDYFSVAQKVGLLFPVIKDDLINVMQLVSVKGKKEFYSENLVDAAFQQIYLKTKTINFADAVDFSVSKNLLKYLTATILITALLFVFIPDLQTASYRIFNFNKEFIPPAKFTFEVHPGNSNITKGNPILITVRIYGEKPANVYFAMKNADQTDFEEKDLTLDSTGLYKLEIPAVRNPFSYFIKADDVQSEVYNISVTDKPVIRSLDMTVSPPSYSRLPIIKQIDNGNISSLTGSKVEIGLTSTKYLKNASIVFSDSTHADLHIAGNNATGVFTIKKNLDYQIIITDKEGNLNENPVTFSVKALTDAYPSIEMIQPNKDILLGMDNRLPTLSKISDDYGFTRLMLYYKIVPLSGNDNNSKYQSIELQINHSLKEEEVNYIWNMTPLNLTPNNMVTYYLEVFDNDNVSGPKSAKTPSFTVRIPSLDELYTNVDKTQTATENKLTETLEDASKLKEKLEELSRDLKKDKQDITWQEKEDIEKSMQKFDELAQKVNESQKELAKMQDQMQQNSLLSKETLEKYMELQNLFKEMSSEEMKKAMEQMQQMLQKLNRNQIQQAMENFKFNEDQFKNSIERTLKLLKRASIEQKLDEITKRIDKLNEKLNELQKQTGSKNLNNKEDKEQLAKQQQNMTEDLKKLSDKMDELKDKMNEFKDMPNDLMEKTSEEMKDQKNEELSEEAMQDIMKGMKQQAQNNQADLSKNMQKMKQSMKQMQSQMQQQNQKMVFNDMMHILDDLITMSNDQEALRDRTQNLSNLSSSAFNEMAQKQNNLQSNMSKILTQLNKLSQKTFAISPEMGKALGQAQSNMRQSTTSLQNRNSYQAQSQQQQAMRSLNEAAASMKGSMESMLNGSGGGGGMMSLMQQLQQLSQQQMNLNNLTQQLQKGNLSMQQQAELQRLAQQQSTIQKSLEQLNKESKISGQSKKIPANLEDIAREMQEVVSDLKSEDVDNNLIQKQERILSRLLDAQRSINDRDFEKTRESKSGESIARRSPGDINFSSDKGKNQIKDELIKAVQEGYSKDYEDLIRKYYEALQKESIKNQ